MTEIIKWFFPRSQEKGNGETPWGLGMFYMVYGSKSGKEHIKYAATLLI